MRKFQSGDKVQHLLGGPIMIVDKYVGATSQVLCKWWDDKTKDFSFTEFHEDTLVKHE